MRRGKGRGRARERRLFREIYELACDVVDRFWWYTL